jgi:hypothetical protein
MQTNMENMYTLHLLIQINFYLENFPSMLGGIYVSPFYTIVWALSDL